MKTIKDLDIVALTEDIEATHFETKEIIKLSKGQVGTVVMEFDGSAFEVEFSHQDGTTYAMETIPATMLMLLHYELVESVSARSR
ncbi:DUF4926 domain-containing protein [Planktothrix agardhii 1029]|jgi:hypothetical protein|uniref:DUF4926 domain-containing protein n=1 Tax=Planktothrix agardhii TaxID=1160 RepID=UPI0003F7B788|nr:DUF4926 domain-containing protein [Planktothrix agardhii]MCB8763282.1 DUF4926 domain-containing protein [Planktothrix agardhii 1809]MCB8776931.1 DUF4926 domain-containing protein [Planktothrix agardhii 1031]MCB8781362.1 DUF4926 domain-containing protein [Planktothrix agardhii 1808]MCF3567452.1 DUF4926 domain-containing protein [Planktothrix agardhii 1807]MCF3578761.1 DUF4926 domain-containing protein [Planktothrix agardhii 1812]